MNKIKMTTAESTLRSSSYASPETLVSEMHSEGILCMSGRSLETWTEGAIVTWDE